MANAKKNIEAPDAARAVEEQLAVALEAAQKADAARDQAVSAQLSAAEAQGRAEAAGVAARAEAEALQHKLVILTEEGERGILWRDLEAVRALGAAARAKVVSALAELELQVSILASASRVGTSARRRLQAMGEECAFGLPTPSGYADGDPHDWAAIVQEVRALGGRRGLLDSHPFEADVKINVHRLDVLEREGS